MLGNAACKLIAASVALCSAAWAVSLFANNTQEVQLSQIANSVLSGAPFQHNPVSEAVLSTVENREFCNPREIRAAAIIRLRLYEVAVASLDTRLANERLRSLRSAVKKALGCVPTDGLLWFIDYWSALNEGARIGDHSEELRMSYRFAPYEGWIALRSPYVLAIYDILPPDLQESARKEFVAIVRTGLIRDAAKILKGAGWRHRDLLIEGLEAVPLEFRIQLDRTLRAQDITVDIPGISRPEFRPWRN
ncbi:hypothetical protein [Bradyrhizobium commune]|uniref:Uncharacterized protein n=1 Tax=Bradyrhizobium commune TaxID=83627 RepID=A0A7S9D318_9BRAD|nr:hypothetical protein [Bradyrhizobium commune]QPF90287.1 hypothetical protein IC761_27870 [Bradyrhizobium commune]